MQIESKKRRIHFEKQQQHHSISDIVSNLIVVEVEESLSTVEKRGQIEYHALYCSMLDELERHRRLRRRIEIGTFEAAVKSKRRIAKYESKNEDTKKIVVTEEQVDAVQLLASVDLFGYLDEYVFYLLGRFVVHFRAQTLYIANVAEGKQWIG